jgi:hypothetical protein
MVGEHTSVSIEAAAAWVDVDVLTIKEWSAAGSLQIERLGDMEVVKLDHVRALAERRESLRARLSESEIAASRKITGLQKLVRERAGTGAA